MSINRKHLLCVAVQAAMIVPLGLGLVGCGGSDDYEEPVKIVKPDANDPTLRDEKGVTDKVYSLVENTNDNTVAYADNNSKVALLDLQPSNDSGKSLDRSNISSYRTQSGESQVAATLIDSPNDLYSSAAMRVSESENEDGKVITTSDLNAQAEKYLRALQARIGSKYDIKVENVKNGYNKDGSTVNLSGSITLKPGATSDKFPMLNHKRMRDEMIAAQIGVNVWTTPQLKSNWGTANAESEAINFNVTTWAYKGSTYLVTSAWDKTKSNEVENKFSRYNTAASISAIESFIESSQSIDKNNPALADSLGKTEAIYYLPKDGEGRTSGYNDNIGQVALLNIQPNGDTLSAIKAENISLYRLPRSGEPFETGVAITPENALGAILMDDPELRYSAAGAVVSEGGESAGLISAEQLHKNAESYLSLLKNNLGGNNQLTVKSNERTSNIDGDVVVISGSIKQANSSAVGQYPMVHHKRLRDEMLSTQFGMPVWTMPTLQSDWGKPNASSQELNITVTTWTYKGSIYRWVSTYDPANSEAVQAKYGRYNSAKDLSSIHHSLVIGDETDKKDPSVLDKTSKTEQVYYFLKDPQGLTADYVDNVSKLALRNVKPTSNAQINNPGGRLEGVAADLEVDNVSLLRLPKSSGQFPNGVAITPDTAIGSLLLDDPELRYSAAGNIIALSRNTEAEIPEITLSDNANSFFNILKYRLGSDYDVKVTDVERHQGIDGLTITLRGDITRNKGVANTDKFPILQHKRMRDEMLMTQYNRPIWTMPTLKSNWGSMNAESEALEFTVTTWGYKGGTYLWTSAYDKGNAERVESKYGRFNRGEDLSSAQHSLKQSEGAVLRLSR